MGPLGWVSLVTLGVRDVAASTRFYTALGWRLSSASQPEISFLSGGGVALALWSRDSLAEDAAVPPAGSGFRSLALAANVAAREDVDAALEAARRAGATVTMPAADASWGGRTGYFQDPDGHLWEVAWNPFFPRADDGTLRLPA